MLLDAHASLIHDLQTRIGRMETAGRNARFGAAVSSGFDALDRLLPGGGWAKGSLVEWFGDGQGAVTLALAVAGAIARQGGVLVLVDHKTFFPPAAAALGVPLQRTVVIDPGDSRLVLWTWEQSLRCEGVAVTLGRLGRANDVAMRRLQLAAAAGGGLGFLLRPSGCRAETSWAEARLVVSSPSPPDTPEPEGRGEGGRNPSRNLQVFAGFSTPAAVEQPGCFAPSPKPSTPLAPLSPGGRGAGGEGEQNPRAETSDSCMGSSLPLTPFPSPARGEGSRSSHDAGEADTTWRLRVELAKCRGGFGGGSALVELHHETNDVPLAAQLADPTRAD